MSTPRSASSSPMSARSARPGCCCSPRSSSPTSCRTPMTRWSRSAARRSHAENAPNGGARHGQAGRAYCGALADTLALPMRGGAGRCVRPHVAPGPIPTSWGPSLSESWLRHMVTHLLRRATEELHADGRTGSTPQLRFPPAVPAPALHERWSVNILFCGDVMGRPGREAVKKHVPALRRQSRHRPRRRQRRERGRRASA